MKRYHTINPLKRGAFSATVALLVAGLLGSIAATDADAKQTASQNKIWKDIGASERIDLSGRLHMLSQRIAASTCSLEAGIEPDLSRGILAGSADEIDRIMNALENGNPLMKIIGAEKDSRVLASIGRITSQWGPVREVITDMQVQGYNGEDLSMFESWNIPYFDDANLLVSEITAQYANPADLLQRDAILVDLAGRQRMRTQMMLKQACEIWQGKGNQEELKATITMFDRTLKALLNGEPAVGIDEAPTDDLKNSLQAVSGDWQDIGQVLSGLANGIDIAGDAQSGLYLGLNEMLIKSDKIVTRYAKYAKHAY